MRPLLRPIIIALLMGFSNYSYAVEDFSFCLVKKGGEIESEISEKQSKFLDAVSIELGELESSGVTVAPESVKIKLTVDKNDRSIQKMQISFKTNKNLEVTIFRDTKIKPHGAMAVFEENSERSPSDSISQFNKVGIIKMCRSS